MTFLLVLLCLFRNQKYDCLLSNLCFIPSLKLPLLLFLLGLGLLLVPDVLLPALVVVALLVELDPEVEVGDQHEESNEPAFECHRVAASHSRQGADV